MNAYLDSLPAPAGMDGNPDAIARGRQLFRTVGCTGCHNVDQGKFVPPFIVPMKTIFPGDRPVVLAQRQPPLNPVLNTAGNIFDDKMAVVNASLRGEERGIALPLLLDLARKPVFLHDNSVPTLDNLLSPSRGATAPHPFYLADASQRAGMVEFLRSLDTNSSGKATRTSVNPPAKTSGVFGWSGLFVLFTGVALLKLRSTFSQRVP